MRDQLLALHQLQRIDSGVLEFERSAAQIPTKIAELESELDVLRTELGLLNGEADTLRAEQQEIEGKVSEDNAKIQKWKRRLNDIKSPREYQALSREIELGERQIKEQDDRVLEIMQELESRQKVIDHKNDVLRGREAGVNEKAAVLREAQAKLNADALTAQHGREEIVAKVKARILALYEQVRKRKNGIAIAISENGTCSGCNVRLRPQLVVELLKYTTIETCQQCSRILLHEDLLKDHLDG